MDPLTELFRSFDFLSWVGMIFGFLSFGVVLWGMQRMKRYNQAKNIVALAMQERPQLLEARRQARREPDSASKKEVTLQTHAERQLQQALRTVGNSDSWYDQWWEEKKERFSIRRQKQIVKEWTGLQDTLTGAVKSTNELLRAQSQRENMKKEHGRDKAVLDAETEEAKTRVWEAKQRRARKKNPTENKEPATKPHRDAATYLGDLEDED